MPISSFPPFLIDEFVFVDDDVARELHAEKKRLLALLDVIEPAAADTHADGTAAAAGDADADNSDSENSAVGSVEEVRCVYI